MGSCVIVCQGYSGWLEKISIGLHLLESGNFLSDFKEVICLFVTDNNNDCKFCRELAYLA